MRPSSESILQDGVPQATRRAVVATRNSEPIAASEVHADGWRFGVKPPELFPRPRLRLAWNVADRDSPPTLGDWIVSIEFLNNPLRPNALWCPQSEIDSIESSEVCARGYAAASDRVQREAVCAVAAPRVRAKGVKELPSPSVRKQIVDVRQRQNAAALEHGYPQRGCIEKVFCHRYSRRAGADDDDVELRFDEFVSGRRQLEGSCAGHKLTARIGCAHIDPRTTLMRFESGIHHPLHRNTILE